MVWVDPRTWLAGEQLTAARLNELRDALKAIGDPWTDYTPTWTGTASNPTNYTGIGSYVEAGKLIKFKARVTANASGFTVGSGLYRISLPVAIADATGARFLVTALNADVNQLHIGTTYSVTGTTAPVGYNSSAAGLLAAITPTAPFVPAANDYIEVTGVYEGV